MRDGRIEFRYVDSGVSGQQWLRIESATNAFDRFESFLKQLNWFGGIAR
jgi:hypothetical protein